MDILKTLLIAPFLLLLVVSCSLGEENNGDDSSLSSEKTADKDDASTMAPQPDDNENNNFSMGKLNGSYIELDKKKQDFVYEDKCDFRAYDLRIFEVTEYSDEWRMEWRGDTYDITSVIDKGNTFIIGTTKDSSFCFKKDDKNDAVWHFFPLEFKGTFFVANTENLENFSSVPCKNMNEIIKNIPSTTWYELTSVDDVLSVVLPCETAPAGFSIEDSSIDFWSGSDPYPIISMKALQDRLTIVYESRLNSKFDSLEIRNPGEKIIQIDDTYFVNERYKDTYPEVQEPCE